MTVEYYVRASGPRGGAFRWRCSSLARARRLGGGYRRKWGRAPTVWVWVSIGPWSMRAQVRDRECATAIRQRALDARRTELERELKNARGEVEYHQRQIADRESWRERPESELSYHRGRVPMVEARIRVIEQWLSELPR